MSALQFLLGSTLFATTDSFFTSLTLGLHSSIVELEPSGI